MMDGPRWKTVGRSVRPIGRGDGALILDLSHPEVVRDAASMDEGWMRRRKGCTGRRPPPGRSEARGTGPGRKRVRLTALTVLWSLSAWTDLGGEFLVGGANWKPWEGSCP